MASTSFYSILVLLSIFCFYLLLDSCTAGSNWLYSKSHKPTQQWLNHGGDIYNRRYANREVKITPSTVSTLSLKWKFYAGGDITVTPAVSGDGTVYFPSWNGYIYAVKALDGSLVWKKSLQKLTGFGNPGFILNVNSSISRATPTIAGDLLVVGISGPAAVIAVKRSTGRLVWSTRLDTHNRSFITMSGTYYNGGFYVGTSSLEEGAMLDQCCTFIGSFSKLDIHDGAILWQTYMLPDNFGKRGEYAGAAIWGSSPSIDASRNHVYIATGNLYSAPQRILKCQERQNNQTVPSQPDQCIEPDNHSNSILALDLDTGKIKWFKQLGGYDLWFGACHRHLDPRCPPGPGTDADFGEAPLMLSIYVNGTKRDIVVAVQKSGFAWALDRNDGSIVWSTEAGPGGLGGGGMWGAATDERRVYTNIANSQHKNFTLIPSKNTTIAGGWVAMDAKTGTILWSTANLNEATSPGPVTVANGVVFGGSTFRRGPIYALDAKTGKILWSQDTGATVYGGISVSDGCIFLGNGYKENNGFVNPNYTAGTSLYVFCV